MAWIPGGTFAMGASERMFWDAHYWHDVTHDGFWIDKTEVTNAEFARFANATEYVTVAQTKPSARKFPDLPPDHLVAGSVSFAPPKGDVQLSNQLLWREFKAGAYWRQPEGPGSTIDDRMDHPVVSSPARTSPFHDPHRDVRWTESRAVDHHSLDLRAPCLPPRPGIVIAVFSYD